MLDLAAEKTRCMFKRFASVAMLSAMFRRKTFPS